ncbi:protein kinase [Nonomuraea sp. NPDC049421]|uniref:protein kinase domain-containing protein n=1 Tax=Nonomuraea sp. NPDC049421 TaxID=3155275 RepID=UPI00341F3784
MRLVPGDPERLGGYWLAARLGAGGRGVVYDAYDDEGRRYAVTVPLGEVGQRYEQVTCRHLARVVAVGADAGVPYVVSEYVGGPDLRQAVGLHGGPYSGDELVALAAALATALRSLHAAGLTHSGLNPECVLLADDGPRVIELGLAGARTADGACPYQAPEVLTGQEAGAAADVFAWGAVVLFAATGDDPFGGDSPGAVMHRLLTVDPDLSCLPEPLAGLVERALAKSPADRPAAAELLIESASELRPPDAYVRTPSLGEAAEQAYLSLTPRQQEEVPGLLLRLLDGDRPHDEGDVLAPLMAAGLLVRRSIRVPSAETSIGKLVAVSDDKVAPASAALYRAWPRLRGWVADERDGMAVHRHLRRSARQWSEHRRGRGHLLRGDELATALGWAAAKRRHVRLNQLERDFISDSVALAKQRRKLLVPALSAVAAVVAVAVTMTVVTVQGQNDLRGRLLDAGARAVAARAEALRTTDPRAAMRLSVAAWRMSPVFEARAALQSSLVQPELGVFTDPGADGRAHYLLRGDELVRWDAAAVTVYDVTGGREVASYPLPPGSIGLSGDGRFAEGASGPVEVATGQAPADGVFTISRGNRTRVYRGTRVLFDVIDRKVALSPDGTRAALSGLDGRVELWELAPRRVRTGVVKVEPLTGSVAAAPALAFSPDGATLAVAGRDGVTLVGAGARRTGAPETLATHHPDLPAPTTPPSPGPGLLALPSTPTTPAQPFTAAIPPSPGPTGSPPSPGVAAAPASPGPAAAPASPGTAAAPASPGPAGAPATPGSGPSRQAETFGFAPQPRASALPSRAEATPPKPAASGTRAGTSGRPQAASPSPSPSRTPDPRATAGPTPTKTPASKGTATADPGGKEARDGRAGAPNQDAARDTDAARNTDSARDAEATHGAKDEREAKTASDAEATTPSTPNARAPRNAESGSDADAAPAIPDTPSTPNVRVARDAEAAVARDGRAGVDPEAGRDAGAARRIKAEVARVVAQAVRAKRVRVKRGDPGSGAERAWGVEVVDGLEVTPATAAGPLVFSPDGRLLALPGDGEVRVWNVAERRLAGSYPLKDPGRGLAFSPDGHTLRYLSGIGSVVSLDVSGLPAPAGEGQVAAFSGNGRVAAKEVGDAIELTDAESRRTLGRIAAAGDLAFDATGRLLAVAGDPVTVWEVASGRQVTSIAAGGDVPAVALSPDGGTLATARGTLLETWDVRSGRRIKAYEGVGDLALAFSPDGMTLAAGTRLLDLRTGQVTPLDLAARASGGAAATALAFSPDGDRLAFGLEGGRVLLWGVRERAPIGTIRSGSGPVDEVRFSPDGGLMAIDAGRTSLWDVRTLREVGQAGSWAAGPAFSQDGTRLRGVALDGSVREFPVDPALTAQAVCERAGGSLTREEWARLIPEADYREVC